MNAYIGYQLYSLTTIFLLVAWRSFYKRNPLELNHLNVKTLIPATALAASLQLCSSITPEGDVLIMKIIVKLFPAFDHLS